MKNLVKTNNTRTLIFHHILSCMVMSREKEPVMQLYTEFKSFFFKKKKDKTKLKKENCTQLYNTFKIKPSKINNYNNNNHCKQSTEEFTTESRR